MIARLILIFITVLSFSAGEAFCFTVVDSSYSSQTTKEKATAAKSGDTAAGKTAPASNSNASSSKSKITASTGATQGPGVNVTQQDFMLKAVDGHTFYDKDGNKIVIPSNVRIINNTRNGKVVNAELIYVDGVLIEALIR
jgi:hypothetical protein